MKNIREKLPISIVLKAKGVIIWKLKFNKFKANYKIIQEKLLQISKNML